MSWEEEDDDIGAWSGRGRGCATSGGGDPAGSFFFWGVATQGKKKQEGHRVMDQ